MNEPKVTIMGMSSNIDAMHFDVRMPTTILNHSLEEIVCEVKDLQKDPKWSDDMKTGKITFSCNISDPELHKSITDWIETARKTLPEKFKPSRNLHKTQWKKKALILTMSLSTYRFSKTEESEKWKKILTAFETSVYKAKKKNLSKVVNRFYAKFPRVVTYEFPEMEACQRYPWWDHRFKKLVVGIDESTSSDLSTTVTYEYSQNTTKEEGETK